MDAKERAHLRALCEDVALPLRAECTLSGHELVDANDEYIGDIETGHSDDDEWCDEVHADLIVGAVNALPALLDALDAAERDRDEARAEVERLRAESEERLRTIQRVAEAVAAEPPMDLVARVRWQVAEVERLRHRLGRVIVAADQIPQHLGATWWGQRLRAALVPPATEVPDDRARGTGGAT